MDKSIEQDDLIMIEPEDCQAYQMPEGLLLIGRSDPFVSQGFFDISPEMTVPKRSRPVDGLFKQITGKAILKVYDGSVVKEEKALEQGQSFRIEANQEYSIANPSQARSVVYWRFDGDITPILDKMRKELPALPEKARQKSGYKELFEEYQKRMQEKQGDR